MIKTILGLLLLLIPFLLIYKFKDKKVGFAYILSFLLAFHLIVAVLLQALGIFKYSLVLGINLILTILISRKVNFKHLTENIKNINIKKINWILVFVITLLFFQLYSVHYNYTGIANTIRGSTEVKNMKYPYPYFSDEWSAITFIKYSIKTGKLPLANPYWHDSFFPNLELPFHSLISEIILLLNLNPLTQYTLITIFTGMLICLLVYLVLKANSISKLPSAIACLSVLYIVNGANLPGLWNLIPIILGIISMLLCLFFMSIKNSKMVLLTIFLTLIFYPPLFIFCTASLVFYLLSLKSKKEKTKCFLLYLIIILGAAFFVAIFIYLRMGFSLKSFIFSYIKGNLFYTSIVGRAIPDFAIWKVLPFPILFLSVLGILKTIKSKKWLLAPILAGLIYWLAYSKTIERFLIEYGRVVVFTSILIVLLAGFGLQYLIDYLNRFDSVKTNKITEIIQISILVLFLILAFSYTQRENWQELKLYAIDNNLVSNPAPPANMYLHEDDLKLFQDIKEERFLTIQWKGTVIGTATDNYPLDTKDATLTNRIFEYKDFMNANCAEKTKIAKEKQIKYVYSQEFNCKNFEIRGVSEEGFHLYEFTG